MSEYRVDKAEIALQREENASIIVSGVLEMPVLSPISFIKKTYESPKIRDNKTETHIIALWGILIKIAGLAGIKEAIDDFTKHDIVNMILRVHSDLTLQEVWKAFELERYGQFDNKTDHFQLFGAEYVSAILKKYKSWKQLVKTQHNYNTNQIQQKVEMSDSAKKEMLTQGIINKYNEYKETKLISHPFFHLFDELLERGIIKKVTSENPKLFYYYQEKLQQAEKEIREELEIEKSTQNIDKNKFKEEITKIAEKQSEQAQIRAKRIILQEFFDKHIKEKTDFESLIKNS